LINVTLIQTQEIFTNLFVHLFVIHSCMKTYVVLYYTHVIHVPAAS